MSLLFREDADDIIQIKEDEPVQKVSENAVHKTLKDSRSIGMANRDYEVLLMKNRSVESGLLINPLLCPYQMISISKVQLDK